MKPLNYQEVRRGFGLFAVYLLVLLGVSVLSLFFLFETRKAQISAIARQLDQYEQLQNQQIILDYKIDSLLRDMALLNTDKIGNSIFMQKRISDEKAQIEELIQTADSSHFLLYREMITRIDPVLAGKDSISNLLNREDFLKKSLLDCMGKYNETRRKVDYNPVRFR